MRVVSPSRLRADAALLCLNRISSSCDQTILGCLKQTEVGFGLARDRLGTSWRAAGFINAQRGLTQARGRLASKLALTRDLSERLQLLAAVSSVLHLSELDWLLLLDPAGAEE